MKTPPAQNCRRQAEEQEARRQRLNELEPIIQKVYGLAADSSSE